VAASVAIHGAAAGLLTLAAIQGPGAESGPPPSGDIIVAVSALEQRPVRVPVSAEPPGASVSEAATNDATAQGAPGPGPGRAAKRESPTPTVAANQAAPAAGSPERGAAGRPASIGGAFSGGASNVGVSFAGLSAQRARSVVYVVDASGPMVTSLPQVVDLVARSVGALTPTQKFGVVLFREDDAGAGVEVFGAELVEASPRNQARLRDWLSKAQPRGRSNPLAGLRAAAKLRPQVVFMLTRSIERSRGGQWEGGLERILTELESLNPVNPKTGQRAMAIKTIQFLEDDPTGIMPGIAARHGGGAEGRGQETGAPAPGDYRVLRREELP
jgi:hypothetical protein